jgi:hypothetical protein
MAEAPSTRPLLDKLGIKAGMRIVIAGVRDPAFEARLRARGATVLKRRMPGVDAVFARADHRDDLEGIPALARLIRRDGTLWILRRKGTKDVTESDTMQAGARAGLVDVKVVSFSDTHSAEKYVYRLRDR